MIKNVVFDFAGTLADLHPSSAMMLCNYIHENYDFALDEEEAKKAFSSIDKQLFYSSVKIVDFENKSKFYQQYNDNVLKYLALFDLVDNSNNQLFNYFVSQKRHWVLKNDAISTLKELKKRRLQVGIISNFDSKLFEIVQQLEIHHLIDYLHISQNEGYEKPQLEFYKSFFRRHALDPKETLYCGDSYILDFLPAKALGMKGVLLDPDHNYPQRVEIISNISNTLEYFELLAKEEM